MGILRCRNAQTLLQIDLARCGNEQVLSAHDVGNALFGIVGNDGELVCPVTVCTEQDEIADVAGEVWV
ncbi:Uncharacterised protein [Neisseria gonorrhoeae]|uniref:Uncharacterized protein n=1 Tax=Neisseria gonorrhoeae TaxID=485 RepID=A0A378VUV0_NEIGO|nr:Uncharacterised protein [Neisseria gonorrhoeae]